MPLLYLGRNLATDAQGSKGYMGIVIDSCTNDLDSDIAMTGFCSLLFEPINLKGYASRL